MVTAEYHSPSGMAYIQEQDHYFTICCSLRKFIELIRLLEQHYGKFKYEAIGSTGVYVMFSNFGGD